MKKLLRAESSLIHLISQALLIYLMYDLFKLSKPYLDESAMQAWRENGLIFLVLLAISSVVSAYYILSKRKLDQYYAVGLIVVYVVAIGYALKDGSIIPSSVPLYIIDELNFFLLFFIFNTISVLYGLCLGIVLVTPNPKEKQVWINLLPAILIPLIIYVLLQTTALFTFSGFGGKAFTILLTYFIIIASVLFTFFLLRLIYILVLKKSLWENYRYPQIYLFALVLPIAGLSLNAHLDNLFGRFHYWHFWIFTLVNALLLFVPAQNWSNPARLLIFVLRCLAFPFTLYFFAIFIPFLPLALIGILALGSGFLLLAPTFLFVIHLKILHEDYAALSNYKLRYLVPLAVLIVPALIVWDLKHKGNLLDRALEQSFSYDTRAPKKPVVQDNDLIPLLNVIKQDKYSNNRGGIIGINNELLPPVNGFTYEQPLLKTLFNKLALQNLTLSEPKLNALFKIYGYEGELPLQSSTNDNAYHQPDPDKILEKIKIDSRYHQEGYYESWVHLNLFNAAGANEFFTEFQLPAHAFIHNYYLDIEGERVYGLLAERKSAEWIYNQIKNVNRDPGILRYTDDDRLLLRIFPHNIGETRKTGIKIIHKHPFELALFGKKYKLGKEKVLAQRTIEKLGHQTYFVPKEKLAAAAKISLKAKPIVIVDFNYITSPEGKNELESFPENDTFLYVLADSNVRYFNSKKDLLAYAESVDLNGGFYAQKAYSVALALVDPLKEYPVIHSIANKEKEIWIDAKNTVLKNLEYTNNSWIGEKEVHVLEIDGNNYLIPHTLSDKIVGEAEILQDGNLWKSGISLLHYEKNSLYRLGGMKDAWLPIVKESFKRQILSRSTTFISLENEAQRAVLLKKQKAMLNGNPELDTEEVRAMSEPSIWIGLLIILFLLFYTKKLSLSHD